jgi:hypothetical protein
MSTDIGDLGRRHLKTKDRRGRRISWGRLTRLLSESSIFEPSEAKAWEVER